MSKPKSKVLRTVLDGFELWQRLEAVVGMAVVLLAFLALVGYVLYRGWLTYHR